MFRAENVPPGPKGKPFIGNVSAFSEDPLQFLLDCSRRYGALVRIAKRTYLVNDPELIKQVFHERDGLFSKTDPTEGERRSAFPASVMNSSGEDWQNKRRKLQPAFQKALVLRSAEQAFSSANAFLSRWHGAPFTHDAREDMGTLCMDIGSRFLFDAPAQDAETESIAETVDAIMKLTRSQLRIPSWVPTAGNRRLRRARARLDEAMSHIVQRYRQSASGRPCLLGTLFAEDESGQSAWLRDELATMIMSGLEPMADGLTWTLWLLARHPGIQHDVYREITTVMGERTSMAAEDLARLRVTEAAVKESLRLYPPAWMTGRIATRECVFGGFHVPAGTMLMISQWVSHRDPRYFAYPDEYRPQRWLDREGAAALPAYAYFPFGGGQRKCIGSHLSITQMMAVVAAVIRGFDLQMAPDAKVQPYPALVLRPQGVRLTVAPRSPSFPLDLDPEARAAEPTASTFWRSKPALLEPDHE
ncbi:cytochrome P450 [Trinickia caryophylli]|uniref:Cytochrome P450 n=2 Tax=Trinickia caryophylli TaxID=28094 RepID=A0A1X7H4H2_TRICW|nr:cytochrome P450 [Trinickia caryophylli]WQE11994.1 cytochrome P450 [Trinickia caryophylli]GLU35613.1 cytochrome P450 hydroxylase [Trinickia caryophylli]SMF79706.1 Cytochrome P450 [Trinickia caryophylli]